MTKILTLKHWQIFGLIFGLPIIVEFVGRGADTTSLHWTIILAVSLIVMILSYGIYLNWFYALGTNLHKKLPITATMNLTRFKFFFFVPFVYMLSLPFFILNWSRTIMVYGAKNDGTIVFISLTLFTLYCIIYCIYFNAKALKTVERQMPVIFSDFATEFFLICFFPIGLWIIQPRINKLFDTTIENSNNQIPDSDIQ